MSGDLDPTDEARVLAELEAEVTDEGEVGRLVGDGSLWADVRFEMGLGLAREVAWRALFGRYGREY